MTHVSDGHNGRMYPQGSYLGTCFWLWIATWYRRLCLAHVWPLWVFTAFFRLLELDHSKKQTCLIKHWYGIREFGVDFEPHGSGDSRLGWIKSYCYAIYWLLLCRQRGAIAIRQPYLRVVGMEQATDAHSVGGSAYNTDEVRKLLSLPPFKVFIYLYSRCSGWPLIWGIWI